VDRAICSRAAAATELRGRVRAAVSSSSWPGRSAGVQRPLGSHRGKHCSDRRMPVWGGKPEPQKIPSPPTLPRVHLVDKLKQRVEFSALTPRRTQLGAPWLRRGRMPHRAGWRKERIDRADRHRNRDPQWADDAKEQVPESGHSPGDCGSSSCSLPR
jgi:hypothetical protein